MLLYLEIYSTNIQKIPDGRQIHSISFIAIENIGQAFENPFKSFESDQNQKENVINFTIANLKTNYCGYVDIETFLNEY